MATRIDLAKRTITISPDFIKPVLCLDLDWTVRSPKSGKFINSADDIQLFDEVESRIWEYKNKGYLIAGVSNQGGVAYGFKTHDDNIKELDATIALFENNPFDIIKCAYHHPQGDVSPYNHKSLLRKPYIGMLALIEVDAFDAGIIVNWKKSLFVGDREEDRLCAENAKIDFKWAWDFFDRCPQCHNQIPPYRLAGLTVFHGDMEFCGDGCASNFGS